MPLPRLDLSHKEPPVAEAVSGFVPSLAVPGLPVKAPTTARMAGPMLSHPNTQTHQFVSLAGEIEATRSSEAEHRRRGLDMAINHGI